MGRLGFFANPYPPAAALLPLLLAFGDALWLLPSSTGKGGLCCLMRLLSLQDCVILSRICIQHTIGCTLCLSNDRLLCIGMQGISCRLSVCCIEGRSGRGDWGRVGRGNRRLPHASLGCIDKNMTIYMLMLHTATQETVGRGYCLLSSFRVCCFPCLLVVGPRALLCHFCSCLNKLLLAILQSAQI